MPALHPLNDGDPAFVGVNAKIAPDRLKPGFVSDAVNVRFDNGAIVPRKGLKKVGWVNQANDEIAGTCSISQHKTQSACTNAGGNWTADATGGRNIGFKPFLNVKGIGRFSDPNGVSWLLAASAEGNAGSHKVYAMTAGNDIQVVNSNLTFDKNDVTFVQCFNVVIMFRGEDLEPLKLSRIDDGFVSITQEETDTTIEENEDREIVDDGTDQIPNANSGLFFSNRLLIPHSRDLVAASDYLSYTRYQPILSNFRINSGSDDKLVALWKFDQTTLLCFKESSVYAVRNIVGNLSDIYLDELTRSMGLVGSKAVTTVGKDVWFLSDQRGIVSLQLHESGKLQGQDIPASDAIQPLIDRINWNSAHKAVAVYWGNRAYWALPVDGATENNIVAVYDFRNGAWSGYDTGEAFAKNGVCNGATQYTAEGSCVAFGGSCSDANKTDKNSCLAASGTWTEAGTCSTGGHSTQSACESAGGTWTSGWTPEIGIKDFITFKFGGAERLFMLTTEGYMGVYDDPIICDDYDEKTVTTTTEGRNSLYDDIPTDVTTRGYSMNSVDFKNFKQAHVGIATNNVVGDSGGITITCKLDGVKESEKIVEDLTFSRTKYHKPFDKPNYQESNANDDNLDPDREDYSMDVDTAFDPKTNGVDPDKRQDSLQKKSFNLKGSFLQLKIKNTKGVTEIKSTEVSGIPDATTITTRR